MFWLSPGIVVALAYAACLLLFGLVGLFLKASRAAVEPSSKHATNPERAQARPSQNGQAADSAGPIVPISRSSGLLASVGPQYDRRRATKPGDDAVSDLPAVSEGSGQEGVAFAPLPPSRPGAASHEPAPTQNFLQFFGLKQQPFDVTPDPAYLYLSPSHSEALTAIRQGIEYLRGFLLLVAEPGMGKTTLMNKLMEELSESARVVFLFQTQCSSKELVGFILDELEVEHAGMDLVSMHHALNQVLLEEMLRGRRFVLIIDEAQNLEEPVLETVRLLSNFETTHSKLIQIVLAGQPQLMEKLLRPSLKQLRQRVAALSRLEALEVPETKQYIEHRLRTAGLRGMGIFTPGAIAQIAKFSQGVPRTINNLCFNAMLAAFRQGKRVICTELVRKNAQDLSLETTEPSSSSALLACS